MYSSKNPFVNRFKAHFSLITFPFVPIELFLVYKILAKLPVMKTINQEIGGELFFLILFIQIVIIRGIYIWIKKRNANKKIAQLDINEAQKLEKKAILSLIPFYLISFLIYLVLTICLVDIAYKQEIIISKENVNKIIMELSKNRK